MAKDQTDGRGAAVYTPFTLRFYDAAVFGWSAPFAWRCPWEALERHTARWVSANHLDVGVGTGSLLARCRFPSRHPRLGLLDVNQASLDAAAHRLRRHRPEVHRADVLRPISVRTAPFDTVSMNFLLHCLPGPPSHKATAIDHLRALVRPGALFFGTTILGRDVWMDPAARTLLRVLNARGVFSNLEDDGERIQRALADRLRDVVIERVGMVALWRGRA